MKARLRSTLRNSLICVVVAISYYLSARALIALSAPPNGAVLAVWLPAGISVGAMLVFGPIAGVGSFLGSALFELTMGIPPAGALGMATVNVVSELTAYFIIAGWHRKPFSLASRSTVLRFIAAAVAGAGLSATFGVIDYILVGILDWSDFVSNWVTMFGAVVMGIVLIAPFIVFAIRDRRSLREWLRAPDFAPAVALLMAGSFAWQGAILPPTAREPVLILVILMMIFGAFRFPPLKMSLAAIAFASAAIAGAANRLAGASDVPAFASLFVLQLMTCSVASIGYFVAAMVNEQNRSHEKLRLAAKVFESSREGIIITDAGGTIVDVNDAYTRLHGFPREFMVGKNPRIMKSDVHPDEFYDAMWHSLRERGEWSGEVWDVRADGSLIPKLQSIVAVKDERGRTSHYVGVFSDITQIKDAERQLKQMATHDALTGLPNRLHLSEDLTAAMSRAERQGKQVAVVFFDLDNFKNVNDALGHASGDELLVQVAQRTTAVVRNSDIVARQGGDEFMVVLPDIEEVQDVERLAERLLDAIGEPYQLGLDQAHVTASIGIALFPGDAIDATSLVKHADVAMYRAKELGRNRSQFFSADLQAELYRRMEIETGLRQALDCGAFFLLYQPRVNLRTGQVIGAEALVRWRREDGVQIMPDEFIPVAEEAGLIIPLGEWVLRAACKDLAEMRGSGLTDLRVSVNISARQFRETDVAGIVARTLEEYGLAAEALELEVTETALMYDPDTAAEKIRAVQALGVRVWLDDFGTGFSSLKYVRMFKPDGLKIDRYFTQGLPDDSDARAIVIATIALAQSLEIDTVAEGPETEEQVRFLQEWECSEGQGFFFSRPIPREELAELMASGPFRLPSEPDATPSELQHCATEAS